MKRESSGAQNRFFQPDGILVDIGTKNIIIFYVMGWLDMLRSVELREKGDEQLKDKLSLSILV